MTYDLPKTNSHSTFYLLSYNVPQLNITVPNPPVTRSLIEPYLMDPQLRIRLAHTRLSHHKSAQSSLLSLYSQHTCMVLLKLAITYASIYGPLMYLLESA